MQDRNLIENAQYWFTSKLDEIETEINKPVIIEGKEHEKEHYAKHIMKLELEKKYFGQIITLKYDPPKEKETNEFEL